jgi:hypothetical protein
MGLFSMFSTEYNPEYFIKIGSAAEIVNKVKPEDVDEKFFEKYKDDPKINDIKDDVKKAIQTLIAMKTKNVGEMFKLVTGKSAAAADTAAPPPAVNRPASVRPASVRPLPINRPASAPRPLLPHHSGPKPAPAAAKPSSDSMEGGGRKRRKGSKSRKGKGKSRKSKGKSRKSKA